MAQNSDQAGNPIGLAYCAPDWGTSFCISKTIELTASALLLFVVVYDMIVRIKKERQFSWFVATCLLMILALLSNICFDIYHNIMAFFYLETFFINIYFILIMYQVSFKFLTKYYKNRKSFWIIFYIIFALTFLIVLGVTIYRFFVDAANCDENWLIIINALILCLSLGFVIVGMVFDNNQKKRILGIYNKQNYYNPLPSMWIWIIVNILSQCFSLIENIIFRLNNVLGCHFTANTIVDPYIKLIFALLGFQLGMSATVLFYRMKYKRQGELNKKASLDESFVQRGQTSSNKKVILQMSESVNKPEKILQDLDKSILQ